MSRCQLFLSVSSFLQTSRSWFFWLFLVLVPRLLTILASGPSSCSPVFSWKSSKDLAQVVVTNVQPSRNTIFTLDAEHSLPKPTSLSEIKHGRSGSTNFEWVDLDLKILQQVEWDSHKPSWASVSSNINWNNNENLISHGCFMS